MSPTAAAVAAQLWLRAVEAVRAADEPVPAPPCPAPVDDPWIPLAGIKLPAAATDPVTADDITTDGRRFLPSVAALALLMD